VRLLLNKILLFSVLIIPGFVYALGDFTVRVMTPDGQMEQQGEQGESLTPLGSLYKLFIYAFLSETGTAELPYTCRGNDPDELFCCRPGEIILRDVALAKSCSPYFSFSRLKLSRTQWKKFWLSKIESSPSWLLEEEKFRPEMKVRVSELLNVLLAIRKNFSTFSRIESATLGTVVFGTAQAALNTWGTTLRVKTFTWRGEGTEGKTDSLGFSGGFAGWLPDGSAIWVLHPGHGKDAFVPALKTAVEPHTQVKSAECVRVNFFDKYPIQSAEVGPTTQIKFKNGNTLEFNNDGKLKVERSGGRIRVAGQMPVNEYIARVLDREVETRPLDASRAFAIAIRTYLKQNSKVVAGCMEIADSSHKQRVSPRAPSTEALTIANWSDGLVLDGVEQIRYHSSKEALNRMSWLQAKDLARSGFNVKEILKTAYPVGVIKHDGGKPHQCVQNIEASKWISKQSQAWKKRLLSEPGFEEPQKFTICRLPSNSSRIFSDLQSLEVFAPVLKYSDDEISLLHEYLHLAFRNHPNGRDEVFIEKLARSLQEER